MLQKRLPSGFISLERTSKCVVNILLHELSHVYYCLFGFFLSSHKINQLLYKFPMFYILYVCNAGNEYDRNMLII